MFKCFVGVAAKLNKFSNTKSAYTHTTVFITR